MNIPKDNKEFFHNCAEKKRGKPFSLGPVLSYGNDCQKCKYLEFCGKYISWEKIKGISDIDRKRKCSHAILIARIET